MSKGRKPKASDSTLRRRKQDEEIQRLYAGARASQTVSNVERAVTWRTLVSDRTSISESSTSGEARAEDNSTNRTPVKNVAPSASSRQSPASSQTLSQPPCSPSEHHSILRQELFTLSSINRALSEARASLPLVGQSLVFVNDPRSYGDYERQSYDGVVTANSGPYALHPNESNNQLVLRFENTLLQMLYALTSEIPISEPELDSLRESLLSRVRQDLESLDSLKRDQWQKQRANVPSIGNSEGATNEVSTDHLFVSPLTLWSGRELVVHTIYLVVLVMHLLEGLTRRATELLLAGLRATTALTLSYARGVEKLSFQDQSLIDDIARDPRTVLTKYNLEPVLDVYVCCPSCFETYPITSTPAVCTRRSVSTAPPCGTRLTRTRTIGGQPITSSVRNFLHQPMEQWVGRMACREGMEEFFDMPNIDEILTPPETKCDFWHGSVLNSFLGPDNRTLFIDVPPGETRLIFALAVDGFNPYQSKTAKQTVSSTAIYMVCLNLPPHLRYLPENMYLVGVIPGPTKPSLDQINPFLRLLVDDLLPLWTPGVRFKRTWKYSEGRLFRAALIPLVCDILAARQVTGIGSHSSQFFCSFCYLPLERLEDFDISTWPKRNVEDHRARATAWRDAPTIKDREDLFDRYGIRWSELLRLPYWDPIRYSVVDSMHNLYLGLLQTHCRDIWGINADADDGDTTAHPTKKPPDFPPHGEWAQGLRALYHGSEEDLLKCKKAVLWHLCDKRSLRRAGGKKQLIKVLRTWRQSNGLPTPPSATSGATAVAAPNNPSARNAGAPSADNPELADEVTKAERSLDRAKTAKPLTRRKKAVLLVMCAKRDIPTENATVSELADRLWQWKSTNPGTTGEPEASDIPIITLRHTQRLRFALGRQSMAAFRHVREVMQLPSWITPAPKGFGTAEHGKLSADQWHTVCTVVLPVALIWAWRGSDERRGNMLANFMDLASAVVLAGLLHTSDQHISLYKDYMLRYLKTLKELYQEATIKPNHHYALHIPDFMELFAPVHSWRSFAFERYNYMLQRLNTNLTFGELESTFMKTSCRAANLRQLINDHHIGPAFSDFMKVFNKHSGEDERGMRLDAIMRIGTRSEGVQPEKNRDRFELDDGSYSALLNLLNAEGPVAAYVRGGTAPGIGQRRLSRAVHRLSKLFISGIYYHSILSSPRDSNILFSSISSDFSSRPTYSSSSPASLLPTGSIQDIFVHSRISRDGNSMSETFLVVSQHEDLNEADQSHDSFRRYPVAGGRLVYSKRHTKLYIIRPSQVVCHVAKTPLDIPEIPQPCHHILPLDRMLRFLHAEDLDATAEGG